MGASLEPYAFTGGPTGSTTRDALRGAFPLLPIADGDTTPSPRMRTNRMGKTGHGRRRPFDRYLARELFERRFNVSLPPGPTASGGIVTRNRLRPSMSWQRNVAHRANYPSLTNRMRRLGIEVCRHRPECGSRLRPLGEHEKMGGRADRIEVSVLCTVEYGHTRNLTITHSICKITLGGPDSRDLSQSDSIGADFHEQDYWY